MIWDIWVLFAISHVGHPGFPSTESNAEEGPPDNAAFTRVLYAVNKLCECHYNCFGRFSFIDFECCIVE